MIWAIMYILIASIAAFGFLYAEHWLERNRYNFSVEVPRAIFCGIAWIACAPFYVAYLASVYCFEKKRDAR